AFNRKKVTCFSKDNIMKMTDGLFHKVFDEIGAEYPDIEKDHKIIDIGSAILADHPESLDVVVTLNLYGDIVSDIAAQITGSVGLGGSANIGPEAAMFEAIHGSAPDIAGKGIANPSGLLNAAVMMLEYIGQADSSVLIQNAWLKTIEEGSLTADVYKEGKSKQKLGTMDFAKAVVANFGQTPHTLPKVSPKEARIIKLPKMELASSEKEIVGCDVHICSVLGDPVKIANIAKDLSDVMFLELIAQRGIKI